MATPKLLSRSVFTRALISTTPWTLLLRRKVSAIVNHSTIVNSLRVVNLLRAVFLVRRGSLGLFHVDLGICRFCPSPWRPKIEKFEIALRIWIVKRDWKLQFRSHLPTPFFCGEFWRSRLKIFKRDWKSQARLSGKSKGGVRKWGLKVLAICHDCLRLVSFCDESPLRKGPQKAQKCTIVDDCARKLQRVALSPHLRDPIQVRGQNRVDLSYCVFPCFAVLGGPGMPRCLEKQHEKCHCRTPFWVPKISKTNLAKKQDKK